MKVVGMFVATEADVVLVLQIGGNINGHWPAMATPPSDIPSCPSSEFRRWRPSEPAATRDNTRKHEEPAQPWYDGAIGNDCATVTVRPIERRAARRNEPRTYPRRKDS